MKLLKEAEKARGKKLTDKDMVTLVLPLMGQYGLRNDGLLQQGRGD
jgi:hypothetical protein